MTAEVLTDSTGWDDCIHGLPALTCSACRHPYRPTVQLPEMEFGLIAQFGGQCPACNLPIFVRTHIAKMSNDTYWHYECAR